MGNWEKQQGEKHEFKERDKTRREHLGKFFFDLAKVTFAGLVIGSFTLFNESSMDIINVSKSIGGGISTFIFAWLGNRIFK